MIIKNGSPNIRIDKAVLFPFDDKEQKISNGILNKANWCPNNGVHLTLLFEARKERC